MSRTLIIGGPRTGKTTLANAMGLELGVEVLHTDDLIGLGWSESSEHIAVDWLARPGPWLIEGVAAVRGLRKWLAANGGRPCDLIINLTDARVPLTEGQRRMAAGCQTIWAKIESEIRDRDVKIEDRD